MNLHEVVLIRQMTLNQVICLCIHLNEGCANDLNLYFKCCSLTRSQCDAGKRDPACKTIEREPQREDLVLVIYYYLLKSYLPWSR